MNEWLEHLKVTPEESETPASVSVLAGRAILVIAAGLAWWFVWSLM